MPNSIQYASVFQTVLDNQAVAASVTGWMDANAGLVIYNGGKDIKIPKMSLDGLGDYNRTNGYDRGSVTVVYEHFFAPTRVNEAIEFDAAERWKSVV